MKSARNAAARDADPYPRPRKALAEVSRSEAVPELRAPAFVISKKLVFMFSLLLAAALWYIDYATGLEIGLYPFYFLPVSLVTWRVGGRAGIVMSLITTIGWVVSNLPGGAVHPRAAVFIWNAAAQFTAFAVVSLLISAQTREVRRERALSRIDDLTGVANVRAFYETASLELARAARYQHPLALAWLDIDDFKTVNDGLGHKAGDELLVLFAKTLRSCTRAHDLVARLGGDEFAVLFPEADLPAVQAAVRKLREELGRMTGRIGRPVTASIGAVCFLRPPGSVDDLIRRADALMYEVKMTGKDGVRSELLE